MFSIAVPHDGLICQWVDDLKITQGPRIFGAGFLNEQGNIHRRFRDDPFNEIKRKRKRSVCLQITGFTYVKPVAFFDMLFMFMAGNSSACLECFLIDSWKSVKVTENCNKIKKNRLIFCARAEKGIAAGPGASVSGSHCHSVHPGRPPRFRLGAGHGRSAESRTLCFKRLTIMGHSRTLKWGACRTHNYSVSAETRHQRVGVMIS